MAKTKRSIGLEILEGLHEIKRGEYGCVVNFPDGDRRGYFRSPHCTALPCSIAWGFTACYDYGMSRKSRPGRCVHCLRTVNEVTSDHVFPKSWYPETTPTDIEKWQIPSCNACNQCYGRLENDLLLRIGLCLDPTDLRSLGISTSVQRSLDPAQARDEGDREHRRKRREKVLGQLIPACTVRPESVFPGFGPYPDTAREDQIGIGVPIRAFEALTGKIVRGITYVLDGNYIEADHEIEIFFRHKYDAWPFRTLLDRFGMQHHRGPGITVTRAVPHDDPISGVFEVEIWGRFMAWATIQPKERPTNVPMETDVEEGAAYGALVQIK